MGAFLNVAGVLWCVLGAGVLATSKSAIHEILACLAVSFGFMFWGLAAIIDQLKQLRTKQNANALAPKAGWANQAPPPVPPRRSPI